MSNQQIYSEFPSRSCSFELLKQELRDKDEMISNLKKKLEIMESFNCSSSSFDALNSFQKRRNSSVVVIAEDEPIPSPTFKTLKQLNSSLKSSKRGSKIFQRQRNHTTESSLLFSRLPLDSPGNECATLSSCRSTSFLPSLDQIFTKPSKKTNNETQETYNADKRKKSIFRSILFWKRDDTNKRVNTTMNENELSEAKSESSCLKSLEDLCPSFSYEEIVSGRAPLNQLNIERIENYLKWDDCIEWLGVTKEQLKLLRSNSLNMRKRSVFLCADQKCPHSLGCPGKAPEMNTADSEVFASVCTLFNESQFHVSSHRKNIQSLRKIHAKMAGNSQNETQFLQAFCHCLHTILSMKKPDEVSNKLMRFLVGFIVRSAEGISSAPQTAALVERFIEGVMSHALEHLDSKEKLVRSRLCQVMVACLNSVQELTDEIWKIFRVKMTERLFDKEAIVRVHAIHSMARLQSLSVEEESELTILDIFIDLMQHDPSVDVRKAALLQIDVNPRSLQMILERRRDVDTGIRKLFYSKKMQEIDVLSLSIQQKDEILNSGLTDREESVRQACTDMIFENWIQKSNGNLIQFLAGLDVISNSKVAETVLKHFFHKLPNMLNNNFNEQFLQSMTAEMAFILRVYCEHQISSASGDRQIVQDLLPELSVMNGYAREKYNAIISCEDEVQKAELSFILNELLQVTSYLDFSDEVGRRVIFETLQEIMANLETNEAVYQTCIKIFMEHCGSTQEFLDIMTEFIGSFRDVYDSSSSNNEELGAFDDIKIMANLRALEIIKNVFSIPGITFSKHQILVAYLDEIVIQSVNSQFAAVQASGLKCLGLGCTIEKGLALEYMGLFCDFYRLGQEEGRVIALQIIFDLIFLFGLNYFSNDNNNNEEQETEQDNSANVNVMRVITTALYDPDEKIQNISAEGFAKLFLHRIIEDKQVLEGLFYLYLHPATPAASPIKQCLSYFFQAFAFISADNQFVIGSLVGKILGSWIRIGRLNSNMNSNVTFSSVSQQLLYLVDRNNLVEKAPKSNLERYNEMYAQMAVDLSWVVLNDPLDEGSKSICSLICKLPLKSPNTNNSSTSSLLKQLLFLQTQIIKYIPDKTTVNTLKRFTANLLHLDTQEEPLDFEVLNEMRGQLVKILPAGIKANTSASAGPSVNAKKAKVQNEDISGNIMDDLTDLLEDDG